MRVRTLVDTVRSLSEPPKTPHEIQQGTAALDPVGAVPSDLLHRILAGHDACAEDLTRPQLRTLAQFYGVSPAYFLGSDADVEQIDASLEFLRELRDPATGRPFICGGLSALTPSGMRGYSELMRSTRSLLAEHSAGAAAAAPASELSADQPAPPRPAAP